MKSTLKNPGVSLMTTVIMRKNHLPLTPVPNSSHVETSAQLLPHKHLTYGSVPHYRAGNYYIAKKRDGICGHITIINGVWRETWKDGEIAEPQNVGICFERPIYVMAERMFSGRIYITDLLCETFGDDDVPFIARYRYLESMMAVLANCGYLAGQDVKLNKHHPIRTAADIDLFKFKAQDYLGPTRHKLTSKGKTFEGYMLIPMIGKVWGGYEPGAKLKVTRTLDIMVNGRVEEMKINDDDPQGPLIPFDPPKYRLDKKSGDHQQAIRETRNAVPFREAFDLLASEANIEFSWSAIGGIASRGFIHPLNKGITPEMWCQLYAMRSSLPPDISFTMLSSLSYMMSDLASEIDEPDPGDNSEDLKVAVEIEYDF